MLGFRLAAEKPPEARRVTDVVIERLEHVYEVDPALMTERVSPAGHAQLGREPHRRLALGAPALDARPLGRQPGSPSELLAELEEEERAG